VMQRSGLMLFRPGGALAIGKNTGARAKGLLHSLGTESTIKWHPVPLSGTET
jgi:hypothetical protein